MVFRKPYAFLIKNFRKIHILLLLLCSFIYYKSIQLSTFIENFITFLSYDKELEPISGYVSIFLYLIVIAVISIITSLMVLLKKKEKPWKLYLIPVAEYIALLFVLVSTSKYFSSYEGELATTTARALDNFLLLTRIPQYVVFLILIIRIIGVDLKNFNFSADEEFLELSQDDREEFEISFEVDKHAFIRTIKKLKRYLLYFYQEHRYICNILFTVAFVLVIGNIYYYFGVSHKTTVENETLNANGFSIIVNDSYYTNKDMVGNVIEKDSSFVVLNITVLNNSSARELNVTDFHIINGRNDYDFAGDTYSNYFLDIGDSYPNGMLANGQKKNFSLIFKVDKNLNYKKFVLYYQETRTSGKTLLRKIKLNLEDVSEVNQNETKKIGEETTIIYPDKSSQSFTLESASFESNASYNTEVCDSYDNCQITTKSVSASTNSKILIIPFSSPSYEGEDLIDFSTKYGKIKYMDSENITREIKIENILKSQDYLGKYLYINVPTNIENSKSIEIIYTIRNQKYIYKIR